MKSKYIEITYLFKCVSVLHILSAQEFTEIKSRHLDKYVGLNSKKKQDKTKTVAHTAPKNRD